MLIAKTIEFDYGHRIPNHSSKCRNLHGHRAKLTVLIRGAQNADTGTSSEGMVQDFGHIKALAMEHVHDVLDHKLLLWEDDPLIDLMTDNNIEFVLFPFVPTAENIARWSFAQLIGHYNRKQFNLAGIRLWETPNSYAEYTIGDYFIDDEAKVIGGPAD